eukprot:CAMPEP_0203677802 /NCGR_PEP_ID=MMETSP0090-20130426/29628_1 /ASSEMBLY_ACC=CAM_ASM_001088 /TAXON_ID=426623 /ORGANISM="Chaetoceros affinis, Strain CCMP159" /LENGTH=764 /DNA_ID=CAMNT_0050544811 /DNA_START=41 /DNA_END=2332 /DNA_ORIENTATION=+
MSKRRLDETGFWKPKSLLLKEEGGNNNDNSNSSNYVFNYNRSPLYLQRQSLPIAKHRRQILYALEHNSVIIIVGETGSGKSTQLPQYLMENGWCGDSDGNGDNSYAVVCTQPRRIAAQSISQRVANEVGCPLGSTVGYKVRFDDVTNKDQTNRTCIKYVTDGTLLREATLSDPLLSQYSVIMIDEAHERNMNTDALLGIVKKVRRKRKNDLRVIVCSATIDAEAFLDFFIPERIRREGGVGTSIGGNSNGNGDRNTNGAMKEKRRKRRWGKKDDDGNDNGNDNNNKDNGDNIDISVCGTIISIDGRQHPVDILHVKEPVADYIRASVDTALRIHYDLTHDDGDILAFLPTGEDIDRAIEYANESVSSDYNYHSKKKQKQQQKIVFLPLYGGLPYQMQSKVFQPKVASDTTRRVIFATNIAETSVTVPHISSVIDCGYVKLPFYDTDNGFDRLVISPISIASARQRTGRAGRLKPGKCYRLYTEAEMLKSMKLNTLPEVLRTNLSSFLLTLKALGIKNVLAFDLMTIPSVPALCQGLESLYVLGAIDDQTNLTSLGGIMAEFPTEPQTSKMMLESLELNCSKEILCVAAVQQVRSLFYQPRTPKQNIDYDNALREIVDNKSDHVTCVKLMQMNDATPLNDEDCREYFVNYSALKRAKEVRKQLSNCLRRHGKIEGLDEYADSEEEISAKIRRCVTAGYFSNSAKLGNDGRYYSLRGKHMISISKTSVFERFGLSSEYILFGETYDGMKGGIEVRFVSAIEGKWLR